jgi:phosphate starvation-inducible PhoH-like protein
MTKTTDNNKIELDFTNIDLARQLFGEHNHNLQRVAEATDVKINARGGKIFIQGEDFATGLAQNVLNQLYSLLKQGYPIHTNDFDYAVRVLSKNDRANLKEIFLDKVFITSKKNAVTPKSQTQKEYIDAPEPVKHIWPWPWRYPP